LGFDVAIYPSLLMRVFIGRFYVDDLFGGLADNQQTKIIAD
jgi:hypothetical protein